MPFYLYDYRPLCASKECFDSIEKSFNFKNKDIRVNSILDEYKKCSFDLFKDNYQTINCPRYLDRLDKVIHGEIYIPKPEQLNDPNECLAFIDIKNGKYFIKYLLKHKNGEKVEKDLEKIIQEEKTLYLPFDILGDDHKVGIKSFTTDPTNALMWSHYATQHQGICLKFELADEVANIFKHNESYIYYYEKSHAFTFNILKYRNDFTINDDYYKSCKKNYASSTIDSDKISLADYMTINIINTKSVLWQYEQEIRLATFGCHQALKLNKMFNISNTNTPVLELKALIFGQCVDPRFKNVIKKSYGNQLQYYDAKPKEGSTHVKIVECEKIKEAIMVSC